MATTNYPTTLLSTAIATDGDKVIPPKLALQAGTGRLSQEKGWTEVNSTPIEEGGYPPYREDFNGALFLLSSLLLWYQQGGIMKYSASLDYEVGNEVMQGGVKYRCLMANGASTECVTPSTDAKVWKNMDASVPAGAIMPFANVQLGGTDNRNPIFWGNTEPDTGWILCDGGSDGKGGTVPNLIDRFILGGTVAQNGTTGGTENYTTSAVQVSGEVGSTKLTIDQMPSHDHGGGETSPAGGHTHERGTMNITGVMNRFNDWIHGWGYSGAFYRYGGDGGPGIRSGSSDAYSKVGFDASKTWTGETSEAGAHTHTLAVTASGGNQGHTHTFASPEHSHEIADVLPPFLKLAYFMKLPE